MLPIIVPVEGNSAVTVMEFPEYVRRIQKKDNGRKSILANEYAEVSISLRNIFSTSKAIPFYAEPKTYSTINYHSGLSPSQQALQ